MSLCIFRERRRGESSGRVVFEERVLGLRSVRPGHNEASAFLPTRVIGRRGMQYTAEPFSVPTESRRCVRRARRTVKKVRGLTASLG